MPKPVSQEDGTNSALANQKVGDGAERDRSKKGAFFCIELSVRHGDQLRAKGMLTARALLCSWGIVTGQGGGRNVRFGMPEHVTLEDC